MLAFLLTKDGSGGKLTGLVLLITGAAVALVAGRLRYHEVDEVRAGLKRNISERWPPLTTPACAGLAKLYQKLTAWATYLRQCAKCACSVNSCTQLRSSVRVGILSLAKECLSGRWVTVVWPVSKCEGG
jgi:hypothetical protein